MIERAAVVAESRRWVGTRYQHQGRLRGVGVDCVGLLIGVMRALGAVSASDDLRDYARQPDGVSFQAACARYLRPLRAEDAQPGDVVSIAFARHPMHLAILTPYDSGGLAMVHALASTRRVVEHRVDALWLGRIVGWHALPGVA